jgi:hypothetical protein
MKRKTWPSSHASIRRHIFAGVVIVAFLAIGVGGWASTAEISGALIAQGSIELYARKARLAAEHDGAETLETPKELAA